MMAKKTGNLKGKLIGWLLPHAIRWGLAFLSPAELVEKLEPHLRKLLDKASPEMRKTILVVLEKLARFFDVLHEEMGEGG